METEITTSTPAADAPRKRKRGYSTAFTPRQGDGRTYLLGRIPATLWEAARAKARREGVSMRALLLAAVAAYVGKPE